MKYIGVYIAALVFVIQLILLPRVGMSWDEPSSFFIGRANLKFWMTGNRAYLNDIKNKELFADSPFPYIFGEDIYPPFQFLVSSAVSRVFAEKLHVLDVPTAHHAGELVIGALGVAAMYGLATEAGLIPLVAALITVVYAWYPTIADLMRSDAKDVPLLSLLTVAVYFLIRTIKSWRARRSVFAVWGNGILFAVFLGLAEGTKPTAVVIVPIVVVWIIVTAIINGTFRKSLQPAGPLAVMSAILSVVSVGTFFLVWPWIWDDPAGKLLAAWSFFKTVGYNMPTLYFGKIYHAGVNLPKEFPFAILLIQSPVELSLLALIGAVIAVYEYIRKKSVYPMFFVFWFFLAMGRFLLPGMIIYARVRHIIDALPAYFFLAGFAVQSIALFLRRRIPKRVVVPAVAGALLGVVIVHELIISEQFFPYEYSYFNALVGGSKTVAGKYLFDIGPSSAVKESMEAIARDSAGKPVLVYPCLLAHVAASYLAPNMKLTRTTINGNYTFVPNAMSWFEGQMTYGKYNHELLYTVRRAGADLFYVYKYKSPGGWRCGWETETNYTYED
jgi:hypothetical protein